MGMIKVKPRSYRSVKNLINVFNDSEKRVFQPFMKKQAEFIRDDLKTRIRSQQFRHKPLNKEYLAWKIKHGFDPRILIQTEEYVDSIYIFMVMEKGRRVWHIGVPELLHTGSGLSLKTLGRIHEFGSPTNGIPARPHWRPVWSAFIRSFPKLIKDLKKTAKKNISARLKGGR